MDVVGVMPPGFELPTADVQLWRPLWFGPNWQQENSRRADALIVLGRLSPTATIDSARAEMDTIAARLRTEYPGSNASFGVTTDPLVDRVIGPTTVEAMRIPLLRGRLLEARDLAPNAPRVVVINEEMARRFWPGEDPIGRRFEERVGSGRRRPLGRRSSAWSPT